MKTLLLLSFSFLLLLSCNQTKTNNSKTTTKKKIESKQVAADLLRDTTFTFDNCEPGKIPPGWSQYFTGRGDTTEWQVANDNGNLVLAQLSEDNPNYHFNEIVFDGFKVKNVELIVRLKGVRGKKDQGGGFIWRFMGANNYYVVRANPLEDNVVLYKVENGKRTDLPLIGKGRTYGVDVPPLGNGWNTLKLKVIDNMFNVSLNNKEIFQVQDNTFKDAGKIGLWTKADALTYFDDFEVKIINREK